VIWKTDLLRNVSSVNSISEHLLSFKIFRYQMLIPHILNTDNINYVTSSIDNFSKLAEDNIWASLLISLVIPGSN
jgi:hypothetical protein